MEHGNKYVLRYMLEIMFAPSLPVYLSGRQTGQPSGREGPKHTCDAVGRRRLIKSHLSSENMRKCNGYKPTGA